MDQGFFVAGVNYRTAPVDVRERMAVAHPDRVEVSRLLKLKGGLSEVVVLWTCNRVEIFGVADRKERLDPESLFGCLAREVPDLASHVFCHYGQDALRHLFRVASGLESMVMGETQITGQVRDAYETARLEGLTGKVLNRVFQKALQTAKMIRTKTTIGCGARSVGGVAVAYARDALGAKGLKKQTVLMIGAGEMASCCLLHLQKKGACEVIVANRSVERARTLAEEFNGSVVPFDERYMAMARADVVISSTGSPHTVINKDELEPVLSLREGRPLVVIDIAVPRDVQPEVGELAGVHLCDIDALETTVQKTLGRWEKDLELCAEMIDEEIDVLREKFRFRQADANALHDGAVAAVAV